MAIMPSGESTESVLLDAELIVVTVIFHEFSVV
jgi:hypothetical protein